VRKIPSPEWLFHRSKNSSGRLLKSELLRFMLNVAMSLLLFREQYRKRPMAEHGKRSFDLQAARMQFWQQLLVRFLERAQP